MSPDEIIRIDPKDVGEHILDYSDMQELSPMQQKALRC